MHQTQTKIHHKQNTAFFVVVENLDDNGIKSPLICDVVLSLQCNDYDQVMIIL